MNTRRYRTLVATSPASARAVALCLLPAALLACRDDATPVQEKSPPPTASASTDRPGTVASATPAAVPPTLVKEKFAPAGLALETVYAVDGAVMAGQGFRVGRVVDEGVEWLAKTVPAAEPALGPNRVDGVVGYWPDGIGVIYSSTNGRAPRPAYLPLTGTGIQYMAAEGGGLGVLYGVARVGDSTIVAGYSTATGFELKTVRGTAQRKPQTAAQACKPGEVEKQEEWLPPQPAVAPQVIGATREGSLVSVGTLCKKRGLAAEIWDKSGKSRIVEIDRRYKLSWAPELLQGSGDELFLVGDGWNHMLRLSGGEVQALPDLERPLSHAFVSTRGELHANDGRTIHRFDGKGWVPVAYLAEAVSASGGRMFMDDKGVLWTNDVHRYKPGPAAAPPAPCSTWFVYLYETSPKNGPKFTYPSTRKALASFPEAAALGLVEVGRHVGVTVASKAQGEAVMAHVRENMKDENPRLFCFDAKSVKDARTIDMNAK